jgi:hypothetical protein
MRKKVQESFVHYLFLPLEKTVFINLLQLSK